jgi:aryl-alcohol dehydrogenase-like predicted oxidoreductase
MNQDNPLDTANAYRDSEKKMGRALGDVRDTVLLLPKPFAGTLPVLFNNWRNSLKAMKTDYIDIYSSIR